MALAGCPEYFLHHSNYKESMDRTSSRRSDGLIVPSFQRQANQNLPHHHDDDVDLEQLVNDMNSSMESVYSTQADTTLLLNNGHAHTPNHHHHHHHHQPGYPGPGQAHRRHTPTIAASSPSRDRLRHSQPMHIQAVRGERCLQDATDAAQTSAAALGTQLGTSAGRKSRKPLNPSVGSGKTVAHFRFTGFQMARDEPHPGGVEMFRRKSTRKSAKCLVRVTSVLAREELFFRSDSTCGRVCDRIFYQAQTRAAAQSGSAIQLCC
ncbi:hypothetical protein fugu_018686 [Takifugu bimaculatus]|uniref:Uncharacterized protein n=1 Tax=Takifugu bimaculatus TaxID=433685 RepID=A0A4Z2BLZ4_9TELE|nr:hypothetical protein fugu_018686 [Takifugu bimaculatus]